MVLKIDLFGNPIGSLASLAVFRLTTLKWSDEKLRF